MVEADIPIILLVLLAIIKWHELGFNYKLIVMIEAIPVSIEL